MTNRQGGFDNHPVLLLETEMLIKWLMIIEKLIWIRQLMV